MACHSVIEAQIRCWKSEMAEGAGDAHDVLSRRVHGGINR